MLLDRGLIIRAGNAYRPTGEIETLDVPETLQALIAARLDGLSPEERRVVQDASVLGRTFTLRGLSAVTGWTESELTPLLQALIRKEVVSLSADPLSPERGQYGFLQDLVKKVAYDTLSRRDKKSRHLAAAAHLRSLGDDEEVVEVVAAHYLDAFHASPDDPDAADVKAEARGMLVRAAERAASLGANAEAQRSFERAIELTDDPLVQADLHEHAGIMAYAGTRADEASMHYGKAIALFEAAEATHAAARVSARNAEVMWDRGRIEQGLETMDRSFQVLALEEPDADLAALAAQLGRFMFFAGDLELAFQRVETALDMAEALLLPEVLSQALNTKAIILVARERAKEGLVLLRYALEVALENDKPSAAIRAYFNLSDTLARAERFEEAAAAARDGLALARRVGNRNWEWFFLGQGYSLFTLGEWDEVLELQAGLPEEGITLARLAFASGPATVAPIHVHRGELDVAAGFIERLGELETSADIQERAQFAMGKARVFLARGNAAEALRLAETAWDAQSVIGVSSESVKEAFVVAVEAALELGDVARAAELIAAVDALPPGRSPQFLQAHAARFRAVLAGRNGEGEEAERLFKRAAARFRELSIPFYLGVTRLEHAEWLHTDLRVEDAAPLLEEARTIFARLGARPWLDRVSALSGREVASLAP
jgi:tetratricopeptide (TPR) repeat protein